LGGGAEAPAGGSPLILWNHRWEFDKAPEGFVRTVTTLAEEGHDFRVAVAGERGDNPSATMLELPERLGERLVQFGAVPGRGGYARLVWEADISISSTRHEFFGISTVEAMWCGCLPIAPRRYNYPALVPEALQERCLYEREAELLALTREAILARPGGADRDAVRASAGRFGWEVVGPRWEAALAGLDGSGTFATK
ncbi:MAG: glycosyltransferase, partial [Dehalococcoidia bacterium]|nr:glycosyltransferase [Dehalococcoidia bacterium]